MSKPTARASIKYALANARTVQIAPLTLAVSGSLAMAGNTIEVDSLASGGTPGVCTLRDAIIAVNYQVSYGTCQGPTADYPSIIFADGLNGTITESDSLVISESVRIDGDERINIELELDPGQQASVLVATDSVEHLTINGLGVSGGSAENGGGLYSKATNLTIRDSVISENFATNQGGGVFHASPEGGEVEVRDSEFSENLTYSNGGGLYLSKTGGDEVRIQGNVFLNNQVLTNGGGILLKTDQADDVIIRQNQFQGNRAFYGMGGGFAGDFENGEVGFKYNQFLLNRAVNGAAVALVARNQQINTLLGTYAYGEADEYGGGLYANLEESYLHIDQAYATLNEAPAGGGFSITGNQAEVVINRSNISSNSSSVSGGGIELTGDFDRFELRNSRLTSNQADTGSHIALGLKDSDISGDLSIHSSELSYASSGGAIDASLAEGAGLLVSNSTLFANGAVDFGAIRAEGDGTLEVAYSTVVANGSMYGGAGISSGLECAVRNSIFANYLQSGNAEFAGQACSVRHSLINDTDGSSYSSDGGNLLDVSPDFDGGLEDHGGYSTRTIKPAATSSVIFAGHDFGNAPQYDQRGPGFARISGEGLDMGAHEFQTVIFRDRFEEN